MQIFMTGIDHALAPVHVREQFAYTTNEKQALANAILSDSDIEGCVLLCTCNRTELWVSSISGIDPGLAQRLCASKGLDSAAFAPYFVNRQGREAVSYLFALSSGLRSRILGEDQILAQVKKALDDARAAGYSGSVLDVLFRSAVTGAKKVKTQLSISTANASAVDLAIDHLVSQGLEFRGKKCLVIGNGEMGKRAAAALLEQGADVTVTIRQYRSGIVEVIPGCKRINYTERYSLIPQCQIVVSATSSPNTTLTRQDLSACGVAAGTIFIDLAVPRDIDPEIRELPGLELLDIDSFSVPQTEELSRQLEEASALLAEQQTKFENWAMCRDLLPVLDQVGVTFSEEMLFRMGGALKSAGLTEAQKDILCTALRDAAQKEFKKAIFTIRDKENVETFRRCVNALSGAGNTNET